MSFKIGKTYQIVLTADLDGNTLPFPHTMIGTCLSFDKEYATFLDPMTNIVRGMKVKQGEPKDIKTASKSNPPATKAATATKAAPAAPATKAAPAAPAAPAPKAAPAAPATPATKAAPAPDAPAPKGDTPEVLPANMNARILQKFKAHLASKESTFSPDLTSDLEAIQKRTSVSPGKNYAYSFTGGLAPNPFPLGTGPSPSGFVKSKYEKLNEETCFFLFDTKHIIEKGTGLMFLVALPKSECDQYMKDNKIDF